MTMIHVEFEGHAGTVGQSHYGVDVKGKWASHTGYRHHFWGVECFKDDRFDINRTEDKIKLIEFAEAEYNNNKKAPFLVGRHDCELWSYLDIDKNKGVTIRLPSWHESIITVCLESYGFTLSDKINDYWTLPADQSQDIETVRSLLKPLLARGSRLTDEHDLAAAVDKQAQQAGYLPRQLLSEGFSQASLF